MVFRGSIKLSNTHIHIILKGHTDHRTYWIGQGFSKRCRIICHWFLSLPVRRCRH